MTDASCPSCSQTDFGTEAAPAGAGPMRHTLSVPGMHCAGCMRAVENALLALPGVRTARVNFSLRRVTVTADTGLATADMIAALGQAGHPAHELNALVIDDGFDRIGQGLAWRMGLAAFAMMNVMLLSVAVWSGASDATRDLFHWISAAIAMPATIVAARPFFASAFTALRARHTNMDVPISLAILLALAMSLYETSQGGEHAYFDAALSLTFFLLVGRFLDHKIKRSARSAARELTALEPHRVTIETPDGPAEVALSELAVGDIVNLPAGSRLPVDGTIVGGNSLLDTSFITGEADPTASALGARVTAGTVSLTGPLSVRADTVGEDTSLRRLAAMIDVAESARGAYRSVADRAAALYVPVVHILAIGAAIGWLWVTGGDLRVALNVAVAVLIITCPCALGLAVPAVATSVTARLMAAGAVLKSDTALERLAEVDAVVFDKTGTLTETRFLPDPALPARALAVLKGLALASNHPLSRAIGDELSGTVPAQIDRLTETAGLGVAGLWNATPVSLGTDPAGTHQALLSIGAERYGLTFGERALTGAAAMVAKLHAAGYRTFLLSGDKPERVRAIAGELGIGEAHARMSPQDKTGFLADLSRQGIRACMVGDGLNDTAALAQAHASMAPSTALDASRSAADVVILRDMPGQLPVILALGRKARRRMKENFAIAVGYNLIAIPVALLGFATPLIAAIAMSSSSITVILNAFRTRVP